MSSPQPVAVFQTSALRQLLIGMVGIWWIATPFANAADVALADQPLFATRSVPGNLVMPLSVEFPTAVSVAHGGAYDTAKTYLGYFDPKKCYLYQFYDTEDETHKTHFAPAGLATNHQCLAPENDHKWSGNFLNWATTPTIDPFRWAMTGGYRIVDTAGSGNSLGVTILEKAWASDQGHRNFPLKSLTDQTIIQGATPFSGTPASLNVNISARGNIMSINVDGVTDRGGLLGTYYGTTDLSGIPQLTHFDQIDFDPAQNKPFPAETPNQASSFSAQWTSFNNVVEAGTYTFRVTSKGSVRLFVNGSLLINNWADHLSTQEEATLTLSAAGALNLRLQYISTHSPGQIQLEWKRPGQTDFEIYAPGKNVPVGAFLQTNSDLRMWYKGLELPVRVKVCDPSAAAGGLEANCKPYGSTYKPEGLLQEYSQRLRYGVIGYLANSIQDSTSLYRDGGVLRARQKFIGPLAPSAGAPDKDNSQHEWDSTTGVFITNPDSKDAENTAKNFGIPIANSGVINYINKFGETYRKGYKSYDPVGELYYAALRYIRHIGNVPEWSKIDDSVDLQTKKEWSDGFPIITEWDDPIIAACQRNFILGIGDVNTHADKNVPSKEPIPDLALNSFPSDKFPTGTEPAKPEAVLADHAVDAVAMTDNIGRMEGFGPSFGTKINCCSNSTFTIAGLALYANVSDLRSDLDGTQNIKTYWIDVLEGVSGQGPVYKQNNQFYLAAKYGGFDVPEGVTFNPTTASNLESSWWFTNGQQVGNARDGYQNRPDNYFTAGAPDTMVSGLKMAFEKIYKESATIHTTAYSPPSPNIRSGGFNYAATYSAKDWTGEVSASQLTYDRATNTLKVSDTPTWTASSWLNTLPSPQTTRTIVTYCDICSRTATQPDNQNETNKTPLGKGIPFQTSALKQALGSDNLATARMDYSSFDKVAGVAAELQSMDNYIQYLRGDHSLEQGKTNGRYRTRASLLGDIVNAKVTAVGPPSAPYTDLHNVGYSAFKKQYTDRATIVYAGANDGMLHAFKGGSKESGGGAELFAYIPSFVYQKGPAATTKGLAALGSPNYVHHYFVDAHPVSFDVDFLRAGGNKPSGDDAAKSSDWHTILIGGLGKGGRGYYALDITDPKSWQGNMSSGDPTKDSPEDTVAKKVLWEFPPGNDQDLQAKMGYSYGEPSVVKTAKYGWVVIFSSGYNNSDGKAYFFFVHPVTGALLETVAINQAATAPLNMGQQMAYIPDYKNYTADAIYAGDLQGNLWRLDLTTTSEAYAQPTQLASLTNQAGDKQPITTRPLVEVDPSSQKRYVLVGTGKLLDESDISSTSTQSFYALADGSATYGGFYTHPPGDQASYPLHRSDLEANTSLTTGISSAPTSMLGWYFDLKTISTSTTNAIAWRVDTQPVADSGFVAFAANQPNGDTCSPSGQGKLFVVKFANGKTILRDKAGNALTSFDSPTSPITDVAFTNTDGKWGVVIGNKKGETLKPNLSPLTLGMTRLNWREVPAED